MIPRSLTGLALVLLVASSAPGSAAARGTAKELPPPDSAVSIRPGDADYRIGPQDLLDVNVFQVPDLSKSIQVDSGGKILLPLIGSLPAAGRTAFDLSQDITTALKQRYLKDPQVVVSVKEASSQKVTVDGAVQQPGIYPLQGPTTLMQAIALSHGVDPRVANLRKVAIIRVVNQQRTAGMFDLAAIRAGKAQDPQVYGQDVIIVDTSGGKSFLRDFSQTFPLFQIIPFL
ncbi:polysaccharide biosynthesis/export family protein [Phenylobacterium sp.]|jgi:polysaccharide export outer membrane protein|uniref:polysaccharide biosynthesis/export family protein n=1 Tax=Phenylobacterium sp. TaxID=1871053 RepID=UPI002F406B66